MVWDVVTPPCPITSYGLKNAVELRTRMSNDILYKNVFDYLSTFEFHLKTCLCKGSQYNVILPMILQGRIWNRTCCVATHVNILRPRQNSRHVADATFKSIFFNENLWIWIEISLKFVPEGTNRNIAASDQIMAWRRPGGKPSSEPMLP